MSENKRFDELDKKIASARRLKKAIECRTSFVDFVKYTMPDAMIQRTLTKACLRMRSTIER